MVVNQLTFTDIPVFRSVLNNGLSLDYRLGESTVLSLRGQAQLTEQAFYSRNIALIATRAVQGVEANGTTMNVAASSTGANNPRMTMSAGATDREMATWMIKPSFVYTGRNIWLEVALAYSLFTHEYIQKHPGDSFGNGQVTSVTATLFPVGWTASRNDPSSTAWNVNQTSGPNFRVLENWQPSASTSNVNRSVNDVERERFIGQLNLRYRPNWGLPTFFKTGMKSDEHIYRLNAGSYAYTYVGPTGDRTRAVIPVAGNTLDLNPGRYGTLFSSAIHVRDVAAIEDLLNQHPEYFVPAPTNATNATNLFPDRYVRERIDSAYVMANTQWNRWMFQAGVRTEQTRHVYRVYERSVAERRNGRYKGVFLSGAAKYRFRPDLIATFGFSQSVRRPDYGNLTGVATIDDNLLTGNIPNPLLRPETGSNYSARLEYFFEPAGNIAAGVFQSDIADLIYQRTRVPAEEIGLGGEYPGYLFTSWGNRDASYRIQGFELEYRHQLVFLPGALRGIGVFANYTRTRNSDPSYQFNIAPGTASVGLSFRYRKLNAGLRASWTDEKLFSATDYVKSRTMVGLSFDYKVTERTAFFVTGRDLLKSPIQRYDRQLPDHQTFDYRFATQWTIGVNGIF
jgi:TonB-dependent receptor